MQTFSIQVLSDIQCFGSFREFLETRLFAETAQFTISIQYSISPVSKFKTVGTKTQKDSFYERGILTKSILGTFYIHGGTAMAGHKVTQSKNVDTKRGVATKSIHRRLTACDQQEIMKGGQVLLYKLTLSEMGK